MRICFSIFATLLLTFLSLGFSTSSSWAADVQWPAQLGKWTLSATAKADSPGEPSALEKEAGLVSSSSRVYTAGDRSIPLTLYTFRDSSGAYQAFSSMQRRFASMNSNYTVVQRSNLVLQIAGMTWIDGESDRSSDDLKDVVAWEKSVSDRIPLPPIGSFLPEKDRERFSELYALGPVALREAVASLGRAEATVLADEIGFSSSAEAMLARYKSGSNEAVLLLIEYPTPQLAEQHIHHLQTALATNPKLAATKIERRGSLLSLALEPTSEAYATTLRGAVSYGTQVTWNEPHQTATEPPLTSMIAKIIILTGIFMVVAVVLGVAFGGVRVITKIFFPGKVFDRPEQMEVLQLGLTSKRIDPRDFY